MRGYKAPLTGVFTGLALFTASAAQAQQTAPLPAPLTLPTQPFNLDLPRDQDQFSLKQRDFYGDPRFDRPEPSVRPDPRFTIRYRVEEPARNNFFDAARPGEFGRQQFGAGTLSIKARKGLSIQYRLRF